MASAPAGRAFMGAMMKRFAIAIGCLLATAGCSFSVGGEEDALENGIRDHYNTMNTTVSEIELTKEGPDRMTGFAQIRGPDNIQRRVNCSATRDTTKGASNFNWRCLPALDQAALDELKTTIRTNMAQRGEVRQLELNRQDDNRATGFVVVGLADGSEGRANCTASRENPDSTNFNWECVPAEGGAAAAPAEAPAEGAPAEDADK